MNRRFAVCMYIVVAVFLCCQCKNTDLKLEPELFNGRDLTGWKQIGNAKWAVEDGILIGTQDERGRPGDLITETEWDNFRLVIVFKMVFPGNSGVWFRKPEGELGYQMDILEGHPESMTGGIWSSGFLSINKDESTFNRDGWNEVEIIANGNHIQVTLNGTQVAAITDDKFSRGTIGFQVHAGDEFRNMKIMVKKVSITPL